jgi:hypothetical protein
MGELITLGTYAGAQELNTSNNKIPGLPVNRWTIPVLMHSGLK